LRIVSWRVARVQRGIRRSGDGDVNHRRPLPRLTTRFEHAGEEREDADHGRSGGEGVGLGDKQASTALLGGAPV
jgi:hypothetical protein